MWFFLIYDYFYALPNTVTNLLNSSMFSITDKIFSLRYAPLLLAIQFNLARGEEPAAEPSAACEDLYDDCDQLVGDGSACDMALTSNADGSVVTIGDDWCKATCGKC